jgi:hypothetical protein
MTTSDLPDRTRSVTLSLSLEAQWTLHHVLLDRIDRERTAAGPTIDEPPPLEVFQAFETVDAGETRFTLAQLEAIQTVLVDYHHATTGWELERAQIEQLLHRVTTRLDQHRTMPSSE